MSASPSRRTCVVRKVALPRAELLRVGVGPDGLLHLDPQGTLAGRGAWVEPSAEALRTLQREPGRAGRSLRRKDLRSADLLAEAHAWLRGRLVGLVLAAHRAGRTVFEPPWPDEPLLFVRPRWAGAAGPSEAAPGDSLGVDLDAAELGRLLRRELTGPIAIRPGRHARALRASLPAMGSLGYPEP